MAEVLHGDANANMLNARVDKTQVYGLQGNDTLTSDGKSDVLLVGGSGDDSLIMSGGNGTLSGGKGNDTFELTYSATKKLSATIEDLDPANDKIIVHFDGTAAPQISTVTSGNDIILRDDDRLNVTVKGVRENDYIDSDVSNEAWTVLWLTNAEREKQNLSALTASDGLTAGAETRVKEITNLGQDGVLNNHYRPDGTRWDTVLDGKYNFPGENLDGGAESPSQVMSDWIGSASHYANIVNPAFQKLGVGYNYFDIDESNHRWYWTQLFADSLNNPETVNVSSANVVTDTVTKYIPLTDGETLSNSEYGATIVALGGSASIVNTGLIVSISGTTDKDTITSSGSFTTINAGTGDDSINLTGAQGVVIEYTGGNDSIYGFNSTDTLSLASDDYYFPVIGSGKDVIVTVGEQKITLVDAAKSLINTHTPTAKILRGTEDADTINNLYDTNLTIQGSDGNDSITNLNTNVSINGGEDNDTITNYANNVTIDGARGYNSITNRGSNVSIYGAVFSIGMTSEGLVGSGRAVVNNYGETVTVSGGAGNDRLYNYANSVTVEGGAGNDRIYNDKAGSSVSIYGGASADTVSNFGIDVTIDGGAGNDSIDNYGAKALIDAGADNDTVSNNGAGVFIRANDGNDYISNDGDSVGISGGAGSDTVGNLGSDVTITGGAGADSLHNEGSNISIEGSTGNDIIENFSPDVTINAGDGSDTIRMGNNSQNELIIYNAGDGYDIIQGFNDTSTLSISGSTYTPVTIDGDIVLEVGDNYIELLNAASLSAPNIIGNKVEENRLITLTEGDDFFLETVKVGTTLEALGGDDFISNSTAYVTMNGGTGDDYLSNSNRGVSINGDAGNDEISNYGDNVTIEGGEGNDSISLDSASRNHVIRYAAGEGSDTVTGFSSTSILDISNTDYTPATVGNDVIVNIGADSITLTDAATLAAVNIIKTYNNTTDGATITGTDGDDYIINYGSEVLINGLAGKDSIGNGTADSPGGNNVTISGAAGNDYIVSDGDSASMDGGAGSDTVRNNGGDNVTITGDEGFDVIFNHSSGNYVSMDGGTGSDSIDNHGANATITAGDGDDTIRNGTRGSSVSIDAGANDDLIQNFGSTVTINAGTGDDAIINSGSSVSMDGGTGSDQLINDGKDITITGGAGNDTIGNNFNSSSVSVDGGAGSDSISNHGTFITIAAGDGNDEIYNDGSDVSIDAGAGNDTIRNLLGSNITITGGAGDDSIYLSDESRNVLIEYAPGDGNDTVWNFSTNDTLNISADSSLVSSVNSGNDVIYTVGNNTILLKDGRDKPLHIIIGESGTEGGGSGGSGGGGSSGSGGGGSSGGNDSGNTSGGTSGNADNNSDASGNKSAVGSRGRGTSTNTDTRGGTVRVTARNSRINLTTPVESVEFPNILTPSTQQTTNQLLTPTSKLLTVYAGGNQIIGDYQSGEKIIFGDVYTGSFYDGAGNFCVGSSTGALVIQNAADKVIDLQDAAGNDFLKAYSATTAGVIDGRGLTGFEIINGSAGADAIFAGDGGSQLWGGADFVQDIMVGGGGTDIFIGGRTQGADLFLNASSADIVHLNDATLSDIVATAEENGTIGIAFNTGNVIAAQSSELLSATFMLSDGSAYRYNHATRNWQSA